MQPATPSYRPSPKPPKRVEERLLREFMVMDFQKLGLSEADARAMMESNTPISWEPIEELYLEAHPEHPAHLKEANRKAILIVLLLVAIGACLYFFQ